MTYYLILAAFLATLAVLGMGVATLFQEGEKKRKRSNRLMQLRIFFQGLVVFLLGISLYLYK
ncbi:twin transmembrane helix small protein [Alphaproteobacteria bacterium]|nr:twin transmembrane helix small protein [Alphaproteobacteria bacterium]